ncbi:Protein YSY6 [Cytospora mali]|uniref:Stress-associated endoplasmic reticulum protein n=1 Tax=Cytospora mali TaxID=578113 RepID=A0A194W3R7_CYTMA|nr:Protein YSY6 [Valsa mali]
MAQTPQQRRANLKFAKQNEAKMGKSEEDVKKMIKKETAKAPISPLWLGLLGFVVFGGIIFEVLSRIFFGGR